VQLGEVGRAELGQLVQRRDADRGQRSDRRLTQAGWKIGRHRFLSARPSLG
jgi:hypothetical protein